MKLTTRELSRLEPGKWKSDGARKGAGVLLAYGMKHGGVAFYFRYAKPDGARDTLPIGHYDPAGKNGLTLAEASRRAGELSRRYQAGDRNLRAILDAEQREGERQRLAREAAEAEAAARKRATLGALLTGYVEQLKRDKKSSASKVEQAIESHVRIAWPRLWEKSAADVTLDDLLAVIGRLTDEGKLSAARKLRSYIHSGYAAAIRARQDARGLPALRELRIEANPARELVTVEGANNARERALSVAELRAYWARIQAMPDPDGALLRLHLLLGGQRVEQLARVTTHDVDEENMTLRIWDGKGRRRKPRAHVVPLIEPALAALHGMGGGELGEFVFTVTRGLEAAEYHHVQTRVRKIAAAMLEAGELPGGVFTPGDLRRTVETRLAAEGVSLDVRAHLQSHGLGGVQKRHYDKHGYQAEMRAAMESIYRIAAGTPAKVVPIRKRKTG
jgi:integrase